MSTPYAGKWSFKHFPWLREMHDSNAEMNIGQKSAQMGYTEWALNRVFYMIDIRGIDCLYVLPNLHPDASDFSNARFGGAIETSPKIANLFSNVDNVGHKRAGATNLYIRGSKSRSALKSIPTGMIVLDEVDEMDQDNIPLALARADGQLEKQVLAISTPTVPGVGINKLFLDSTQEHFFFKCPCCSRRIELTFPDCIKITADSVTDPRIEETHYICSACKNKLPQTDKWTYLNTGEWVASCPGRAARGFHVNQMYSSTIQPRQIAEFYLKSLIDRAVEQEFYNSKLGQPHIVDGAAVTDEQLDAVRGGYKLSDWRPNRNSIITMGVDVGTYLHYVVEEWQPLPSSLAVPGDVNLSHRCRMVQCGKVRDFEEIDDIIRSNNVLSGVIDAQPESRKSSELANRFYGRVRTCRYITGLTGRPISNDSDDESAVKVDRTSWLDLSLGRFRSKTITLPADVPMEYRSHIKNIMRWYEKDRAGNYVGAYTTPKGEDHYAHARNYSEIAFHFASKFRNPMDIYD